MTRKAGAPIPFMFPCYVGLEGAQGAVSTNGKTNPWYASSEDVNWVAHSDQEDIIKVKLSTVSDVAFSPMSMNVFGELMRRHGYGFVFQDQAMEMSKPKPPRFALPKPM